MFTWAVQILQASTRRISQLRYALGIAGVAAAIAIAAILMQGYFSSIGGVVVAVNMGVMLMVALLMFVAAAKAKGPAGKPYQKLYFLIACAFSFVLVISALLSLSSVFFRFPLDFTAFAQSPPVEQIFDGDYRNEESVVVFDLRKRQPVNGRPGTESREPKMRVDRVVRQRPTDVDYEIESGTNGLGIEQIQSPTHPSMTTRENFPQLFQLTTKHSYTSSIPADRFPIGEPVTVESNSVFVNAFTGDEEEWAGACPNVDTRVLTLVILFPKDKPGKEVFAMQKPMEKNPVAYTGPTRPVLQKDGSMVTWTIVKPVKGTGYFIAFKW